MNYLKRLTQLRSYLLSNRLGGLIVSNRQNICYFTGLTQLHPSNREGLLLVTAHKATLYHSIFLSPPRLKNIKNVPMDSAHPPKVIFPKLFSQRLAIESSDYTVAELNKLKSILPQASIINTTDVVETFRLIKDQDEIKLMHRAGQITAQLMSWAQQSLQSSNLPRRRAGLPRRRAGLLTISENGFSHHLEQKAYELGADGLAFPSVVAFGTHTALPHHQPGKTTLTAGPVLLDIGVQYHGYCSDMTRTFCLGTPPPRFLKIKSVVLSAYQSSLKLLIHHYKIRVLTDVNLEPRATNREPLPITACSLDHTARSIINHAGFGPQYIHTTGHGIGLDIHELPSLNSNNSTDLKSGMCLTIEPGIYLKNRYGFRHENTLLLQP